MTAWVAVPQREFLRTIYAAEPQTAPFAGGSDQAPARMARECVFLALRPGGGIVAAGSPSGIPIVPPDRDLPSAAHPRDHPHDRDPSGESKRRSR